MAKARQRQYGSSMIEVLAVFIIFLVVIFFFVPEMVAQFFKPR